MIIGLSPDGGLRVDSGIVSLGAARPVVNGVTLASGAWRADEPGPGRWRVRYESAALGAGAFVLEAEQDAAGQVTLRYALEGLPDQLPLDSFGLRFGDLRNLRAYLRNGYFSWDGSAYVDVDALRQLAPVPEAAPGYAVTQLLPRAGSGSVVVGFDRHDRFQQPFTIDVSSAPATLTVETLWDRKDRRGLERCESERLVLFEHAGVEDGLRAWAQQVSASAPVPPRLSAPPIAGWCSWYNLYATITEDNVLEHLRGVAEVTRRAKLPMWVFQIDDGFTPEMGDWLDVKPQFPRGMKPLLDDIRAAGFAPGLWIAPFMVGNRSRLYREHPDWVVRDRATGGPLAHMRFYAEFRWHKRSEEYYILDTTHPDAFAYLRRVFRTWRRDWGCDYFKTDFMHFGSEHGPDRARWHRDGMTRIEIWRRAAELIREEIGDAVWDGCGCPLWASVGLVDAVRIGRDVGVVWSGNQSAQSLLRDLSLRNFGNGILWQSDPDCILLRERFHELAYAEVRSLAIYAAMAGGAVLTSDALDELSDDRLALWALLLDLRGGLCRFPLNGQSRLAYAWGAGGRYETRALDPVIVQVRAPRKAGEQTAVFVFNTGDQAVERVYSLEALGLPSPAAAFDWNARAALPGPLDRLTVTLAPHDGALFFLE